MNPDLASRRVSLGNSPLKKLKNIPTQIVTSAKNEFPIPGAQPPQNQNQQQRQEDLLPDSPIKRHQLDPSLLSKPSELQKLMMDCDTHARLITKKLGDGGKVAISLSQIQDGFQSRYDDLLLFLDNPQAAAPKTPLSPETTMQIHLLTSSYYEFFRSVYDLNEYFKRLSASILPVSTKRKKVLKLVLEVYQNWMQVNINLTTLLARTSADMAKGANRNVEKLAVASGAPDWEELDSQDATTVFLQGEKFFLGYGGHQSYELAFKRYQAAAELGISDASQMLGLIHELGLGREKNLDLAIKWYKSGADAGSLDAHNSLGKVYEYGLGCPENLQNAKLHYLKASQGGNVDAMVNLGHLLERLSCNHEQIHEEGDLMQSAVRWYEKASQEGYARAQNALGSCYYRGKGVEQNFSKAAELFRKSSDQNNSHALNNLGICYEEGKSVPRDFGIAKQYYKRAADLMHPSAVTNYAYLLYLEDNQKEAFKYFNIGLALGNADAAYHLGTLYEAGSSFNASILPQDLPLALFYYEEAIKKEHSKAYCRAAALQLLGPEEIYDPVAAIDKLIKAANVHGDGDAMDLLGQIFMNGVELSSNLTIDGLRFDGNPRYEQAVIWFQKAIKKGHAGAMYHLGLMHERGWAVEMDMARAIRLFEQASRLAHESAIVKLKELKELQII